MNALRFSVWLVIALVTLTDVSSAGEASVRAHKAAPQLTHSAQNSLLSTPANLDVKATTPAEALEALRRQSRVDLTFSPTLLPDDRLISCPCQDATVKEALLQILDGTGFDYVAMPLQIVIRPPGQSPIRPSLVSNDTRDPTLTSGPTTGMPAPSPSAIELPLQGTIAGTVRDALTEGPIDGVQVQALLDGGESVAEALTDAEGAYSLADIPEGSYTVVARRLGYHEQQETGVTVESGVTTTVDLLLRTAALQLDELVVVGYGEQVAANVTGSVSRANVEDMGRVTTPTVAQSLQGQAPGVFIKNLNAQPGENKVDINIRGFGEPLFVVDGHPVEDWVFQEIDPNDIEDLVVLKDATAAAVYGARAGNGVVLVTTKRGTPGTPQFNYSSDFGRQFLLVQPQMANSAEYMRFHNFWTQSRGETPAFPMERIEMSERYLDNSNPDFPNTSQLDIILRDYAPQQQHNLSVRGGGDAVRYFVSGSWFNQSGILESDEIDLDRYNLRSNLDISLTDKLDLGLDLSVINRDYYGPAAQLEGEGNSAAGPTATDAMYFRMYRWRPFWPDPEGTFENGLLKGAPGGQSSNPWNYMWTEYGGHREYTDQTSTARLSLAYELPFNFRAEVHSSIQRNALDWRLFKKRIEEYNYEPVSDEYLLVRTPHETTVLRERQDRSDGMTMSYRLLNNTAFGNHELSGTFIYEQERNEFRRTEAWRLNYQVDIPELWIGPDLNKDNFGTARESGRAGYVGRLNYSYGRRYSLDFNFRYDGSSRFPENSRWGFFPSVGAAWNISEESFLQNRSSLSFLNMLRLRGSYGRLGYDRAGDWQHLATFSFVDGNPYIYGSDGALSPALREDQLPNASITWEHLDLMNLGLTFELWDGLLAGELDVFRRDRTNVLATRELSLPNTVGAELPDENYEQYRNTGWDASLTHTNRIGEVGYHVGVTVSKARERLTFTDTRDWANREDERRNNPIGQLTGRQWGMPTDGLFTSQEEIDGWADIDGRNNATVQPGDVRFVDRNGDGRITLEDAVVVGTGVGFRGGFPKFTFGINASVNWRGFELYTLWQGAGAYGLDVYAQDVFRPFSGGGNNLERFQMKDSYVPENEWGIPTNTGAKWPCICASGTGNTGNHSYEGIGGGSAGRADIWFQRGDYLRLRNVQLSYDVPQRLTTRLGINTARVYLAGYNVLTFFPLDFVDPEFDTDAGRSTGRLSTQGHTERLGGSGLGYNTHPHMGSYNLGIEISF